MDISNNITLILHYSLVYPFDFFIVSYFGYSQTKQDRDRAYFCNVRKISKTEQWNK